MQRQIHPIPPFFDRHSKILILGSFPSVASRESGFYYGHPQNRFWKLLASLFDTPAPSTMEEKKDLLGAHHLALWDVIGACEIRGSSDSSIQKSVPNPLTRIFNHCDIQRIFTNGKTADHLFDKYNANIRIPKDCLPSSSPANASYSFEKLRETWKLIRDVSIQD